MGSGRDSDEVADKSVSGLTREHRIVGSTS